MTLLRCVLLPHRRVVVGGGWDASELRSTAATAELIFQTLFSTFLPAQVLVPSGRLGFGCRRGRTLGGTPEFRPNQPPCAAASLRAWGVRVGAPSLSQPASPAAAPCLPADPGERAHQGGEQRERQQAHYPGRTTGALRLLHTAGGEQAGQQAGPGQPHCGR